MTVPAASPGDAASKVPFPSLPTVKSPTQLVGEPTLTLSTYPGANLGSTPPKPAAENQFAPDQNRPGRTNVMDQ
jgi:hypothetical protein